MLLQLQGGHKVAHKGKYENSKGTKIRKSFDLDTPSSGKHVQNVHQKTVYQDQMISLFWYLWNFYIYLGAQLYGHPVVTFNLIKLVTRYNFLRK